MLLVLKLVVPVFGLIALGFAAAKLRYLSEGVARSLIEFAFKIVMPALLFRAMAVTGEAPLSLLLLVASYCTGMIVMWVGATLIALTILGRSMSDAAVIAMATCFGNGVMLGFPLILAAFGQEAATPMAFVAMSETVLLWVLGTLHMELSLRSLRNISPRDLGAVFVRVAANPIVFSLLAGLVWRLVGFGVPDVIDKMIVYLAQATIPVALFALGMSLAAYEIKGEMPSVALICLLRLAVYPVLAFVLAHVVFGLPAMWTGVLVIYAAMPVGANAFLFASQYVRSIATVSAAVAISTVLAVLTVSAVLTLLLYAGVYAPTS
jgi:predicted permease